MTRFTHAFVFYNTLWTFDLYMMIVSAYNAFDIQSMAYLFNELKGGQQLCKHMQFRTHFIQLCEV